MRTVVFSPEAMAQLQQLHRYLSDAAGSGIANRFTDALLLHCESLGIFPERAIRRDDIRSGLRLTQFRKRTVIAYAADTRQVTVLGIFHGGQDYKSHMRDG
ncbi:MAG: type II toxin-antitoxin system RelE/ParE family toxin [Steroidobacteraceae bacterium]